ncbi:MAG: ABC transporter ATP-binding protein [Gammaproteobacteria bacterium]|nr:ABC transporter ATP-binding protein [Gammaproteobacteria bacterium]
MNTMAQEPMDDQIALESSAPIVSVRNLTRRYGDFTALDGVSFEVAPGTILGLIGPNGAGKTTTLKALLGLIRCEGDLNVLGMDPRQSRHNLMERVCFISDVGVLPGWIKAGEAVSFVHQVHPAFDRSLAEKYLRDTAIPMNKKVRQLSKGMVTQLHLALVMAIDADLLVLDEPTIGLDILYRKSFYDRLLNEYYESSKSIIVSTHQVEEIESLLTHLLFINEGRIVLDASMDSLADRFVEVLIPPDREAAALALSPVHVQSIMGKKRMLFEGVERERLEDLGELHLPSVADLFVAYMSRGEK